MPHCHRPRHRLSRPHRLLPRHRLSQPHRLLPRHRLSQPHRLPPSRRPHPHRPASSGVPPIPLVGPSYATGRIAKAVMRAPSLRHRPNHPRLPTRRALICRRLHTHHLRRERRATVRPSVCIRIGSTVALRMVGRRATCQRAESSCAASMSLRTTSARGSRCRRRVTLVAYPAAMRVIASLAPSSPRGCRTCSMARHTYRYQVPVTHLSPLSICQRDRLHKTFPLFARDRLPGIGFVVHSEVAQAALLCAYPTDAATLSRKCEPIGGDASCVPGCVTSEMSAPSANASEVRVYDHRSNSMLSAHTPRRLACYRPICSSFARSAHLSCTHLSCAV